MTHGDTNLTEQEGDWFAEEVATFGDRLAAARESAGLKQAEFSKRLGVKKSTIAAWEEDLSEPRANRLSMMAGVLNVSVGWLLTGEGDGVEFLADGEEYADADLVAIVQQLRDVRVRIKNDLDRLAKLEKALRKKI
ncbi:transcriptional repressor DicA [Shimia sp. SK013]|uniref:helix-turn-helix domain-containing protein n=1 Tax=Shimia sp. SK013 TaxID=1389006 RepID=UPI0006CD2FBD|nr:helix-turn-helix transcriptional regulator [Shimia sp. SK013]KPA22187.1 transcriptional repressor DicA [Shimia sp. SK013]